MTNDRMRSSLPTKSKPAVASRIAVLGGAARRVPVSRLAERDDQGAVVALAAFFCLAIAALPILRVEIPPLGDYVNHLARIHLIALDGRDPRLAQFYAIDWKLIPNLAIDLILPPLARLIGIYAAGKAFLLMLMALLIAGPLLIQRAQFGRWSVGPLAASLFLYNNVIIGGLVNYLFGVGLALIGIAASIALRRGPALPRALVSALFVIVLYLCHFAACALYGVVLACLELADLRADPAAYRRAWAQRAAVLLLPFATVPLLMALGPGGAGDLAPEWLLRTKLLGLFAIVESQWLSHLPDAIAAVAIAGAALWAAWRGCLRIPPAAWLVAAAGMVCWLAVPSRIMGTWGADMRLPVAFLFVLTGLVGWRLPSLRARALFLGGLATALVARIAVIDHAWHRLDQTTAEMRASLGEIAPGSTVLVARIAHPRDRGAPEATYLPCLVMIERSSLCSLAFSDPRQQILTVKPPYRAMTGGFNDDAPTIDELLAPPQQSEAAPSGRIYWSDWRRRYDYVYILGTSGEPNPLPSALTRRFEGGHFQLYAVAKPER